MFSEENMDIIGNVKTIENYKAYLLASVADLFSTMAKGSKANFDDVIDELAESVVLSYLLGKRLGINYSQIDERILKKLKLGLLEENTNEREEEDYTKLITYIKNGRE